MGKMVQNRKQMRNLIGIFKDKVSLIKAALSIKRGLPAASVHVAVLRATTHNPSLPPPPHRVSALLSLGRDSLPGAWALIAAVLHRLHATGDAYVALKCLLTLHHVLAQGSVVLKDQLGLRSVDIKSEPSVDEMNGQMGPSALQGSQFLSFYPSTGGRNFLNLSRFRDKRDSETWELSSWVRWYAAVLERNLSVSRALGAFISSPSHKEEVHVFMSSDLITQLDCLVGMVEEICSAPESLENQRNDLVYEAVNFVGDDYRSTQYRILARLGELAERIDGLGSGELTELTRALERLEGCRERLSAVFGNKKRNDAFWEAVGETRGRAVEVEVEEERERGRCLVRVEGGESTRYRERVGRPSQVLALPYGRDWRPVERLHFHIAPAGPALALTSA